MDKSLTRLSRYPLALHHVQGWQGWQVWLCQLCHKHRLREGMVLLLSLLLPSQDPES
jgi:hypothetical protein